MSENRHPYDDFFQKKLGNHESSVSDDLFNRLMTDRSMRQKLDNHDSPVNDDIFNHLMRNREGSDEQPSDAPLRERLTEHPSAVPKDTFNEIIVEKERRRRALAWRSATAILLFFLTYLMFVNRDLIFNNNTINKVNSIDLNKTKSQVDNDLNQNKIDNSLIVDNDNLVLEKNNKIIRELKSNNNKDKINDIKYQNNDNSDKLIENRNKITVDNKDKTIVANTNLKAINNNNQSAIINNQLKITEGGISKLKTNNSPSTISNNQLKNNSSNTVSNSANVVTKNAAPQQIIKPTFTSTSLTNDVEQGDKGVDSKVLKTDNQVVFNASLSTPDAPHLVFDNLSILQVQNIALPTKKLENPCAGPGDGCPTFGKKRQRGSGGKSIYVDIYGAPEYAFRRLSENLPENANYLKARDSVEKPWYAFSAGARVYLVFGNGLALRTGFVYAQTNETAVFDSLGIGSKTVVETYVPRTGGGFDTIRKTEITSGIFRTTKYNRYRSIDIPLQLGFEFPLNDYWSFSINGGANFNISAWRKADILGDKGTRLDVSSGFGEPNPVFNNTLGISVFGSVAAYRQLTGNLQLVIEPSVRHYLQPITRTDYALKQAYTNGGLILGLRYRF